MAFDGITLKKVIDELQILNNAKVNKIFQPTSNNIIINVYRGDNYSINIDVSASDYGIYLSNHNKKNPLNAPGFCMTLRKYLSGSKIDKIYMQGLERICFIEFETHNEMNDIVHRTLVIELMGKYSNIVLYNENKIIIDALKKFDSDGKTRDIMPARYYSLPEQAKIELTKTSRDDFIKIVSRDENKTLEKVIPSKFTGISKLFIQSAIEELHLSNTISEKSLKEIYDYIFEIINNDNVVMKNYKNNYSIYLEKEIDKETENEAKAINLNEQKSIGSSYETGKINKIDENINASENNLEMFNHTNKDNKKYNIENLKINHFLDEFYHNRQNQEAYINYRNMVLKILNGTLDKLLKKMDNIEEKIKACENMEKYKIYGELLIANIYKFENMNNKMLYRNNKKEKNESPMPTYVTVQNYYDNNNEIEIPIDSNFSISKNAEKYFKKYDKMKNTISIVNTQKKQTEKELYYLESLIQEMDNCTSVQDIDEVYNEISENLLFNTNQKSKQSKNKNINNENMLKNYIKTKIDGYDVFVGKNNKQNDYLTLKVANENDMWFHTKDIHGSHLILRCNGEVPKLETIKKCAEISAYYSKAKFSSHVPVDYTLVKYVHKPHGSNPGFVIYTNNKTIYVDPSTYYICTTKK